MDIVRPLHAEQLAVLGEPHRLAVLRLVMASPATLSQLATSLGTYPAWVRHHVLKLQEAGLVELAEQVKTRNYVEKYYRATAPAFSMHALVTPDVGERRSVIALGSHDLALDALAGLVNGDRPGVTVVPAAIGSLDGLVALRQGLADVAGCHLLDADTGTYNVPFVRHLFPDRPVIVVTLAEREQGMMLAPGNPKAVREIADVPERGLRLANRNRGSGTRLWLDRRLADLGIAASAVTGYGVEHSTHTEVADEIAAGRADVGLGIRAAAEVRGLDFVPLFEERYDLAIAADRYDDPSLRPLLDELTSGRFRKMVRHLGGYQVEHTGDASRVAI